MQLGLFGQPHACKDVLKARLSACNDATPPITSGAAAITLPSPTEIVSISTDSTYLTCMGSTASLPPISAPSSTQLSAIVQLSDGSKRELSDERARFSADGPCHVTRDQNGAPVVSVSFPASPSASTNSSSCASDICTIILTYPDLNQTLNESLITPIVDVASILLLPQHYDASASCTLRANQTLADLAGASKGNTSVPVQLAPLQCSLEDYQQVTVCAIAQLTTTVEQPVPAYIDATPNVAFNISDNSQASLMPNLVDKSIHNRLRPHEAASIDVSATLGSMRSESLIISALGPDSAVHLQSVQLQVASELQRVGSNADCSYQCEHTLSGTRTSTTPLSATISFSDGFKYSPDTLLGASSSDLDILNVSSLFLFVSSHPEAVSVNELGDVTLLDNAAEAVTIEMWAKGCSQSEVRMGSMASSLNTSSDAFQDVRVAVLEVYANLQPAMLDVDIGEKFGPPFQQQGSNSSSTTASKGPSAQLQVIRMLYNAVIFIITTSTCLR